MKTLLVLPAIARLSADSKSPAPPARVAGAWVGFLLAGSHSADRAWSSEDEVTVDTSVNTAALNHLKVGDIVFTGRSTTDTVGLVIDRDAEVLSYTGTHKAATAETRVAKAKAISRTLEFLRQ